MMKENLIITNDTFDIKESNNIIINHKLANTISYLNKKGYYTKETYLAKLIIPFKTACLIENLKEKNLLTLNEETRKIIDKEDCEETLIIFKEKYHFENLPKGYSVTHTNKSTYLYYSLKILKEDTNDIEFKSLVELDQEREESIKNLEEWAKTLPDNHKTNNKI